MYTDGGSALVNGSVPTDSMLKFEEDEEAGRILFNFDQECQESKRRPAATERFLLRLPFPECLTREMF